jgi:hypothetical protein
MREPGEHLEIEHLEIEHLEIRSLAKRFDPHIGLVRLSAPWRDDQLRKLKYLASYQLVAFRFRRA